jgi:hypothetical protein
MGVAKTEWSGARNKGRYSELTLTNLIGAY